MRLYPYQEFPAGFVLPFFFLLKTLFQEQGMKIDSSLRGVLLKADVSHIEGLAHFMERAERI